MYTDQSDMTVLTLFVCLSRILVYGHLVKSTTRVRNNLSKNLHDTVTLAGTAAAYCAFVYGVRRLASSNAELQGLSLLTVWVWRHIIQMRNMLRQSCPMLWKPLFTRNPPGSK